MKYMHIESIDLITQTCSLCVVIVLCMAAIMCCNWQTWNNSTAPKCLSKPCNHLRHLEFSEKKWKNTRLKLIQDSQAENFTQYDSDSESDNCQC